MTVLALSPLDDGSCFAAVASYGTAFARVTVVMGEFEETVTPWFHFKIRLASAVVDCVLRRLPSP
jgi:hypothetical protein